VQVATASTAAPEDSRRRKSRKGEMEWASLYMFLVRRPDFPARLSCISLSDCHDIDSVLTVTSTRMPAVFIGHGSPMNAIEHNRFTTAWAEFAGSIPKPRAVLAISAHWYIGHTAVTAMANPKTIHDFYGFPPNLYAVDYPAPGSPELAEEVVRQLDPTWGGLDQDSWGIDHGTWSVLMHMAPSAEIPVVQLSIDAAKPLDYHFDIGAALAPLLDENIFVLCSGNIVHNLGRLNWGEPELAEPWARTFNEATKEILLSAPENLSSLQQHPDWSLAVPSPDHFLPVAYFAGLAHAKKRVPQTLVDGYNFGSLSMTSYYLSR